MTPTGTTPEALIETVRLKLKDLLTQATKERTHFYVGSVAREMLAALDALASELERLQQEERRAIALTFAVNAGMADVSRAELERVKAERDMEEKFANDYRRKLETALAALREIRDGGYEHFTPKGANPWAREKARAALSEIDE